jgi:hypothetical protein
LPAGRRRSEQEAEALFGGMLAFGIIVVVISAVIARKYETMDRTEIATYVVIIAWASLLWGMFLSRNAR